MSRLALILARLGCRVSGSDLHPERNPFCDELARFISLQGYFDSAIYAGHSANNLPSEESVVVFSSAVSVDNPELVAARKRGLKVLRRGEMLAELSRLFTSIVVCGAHGKTSTTALLYRALDSERISPSLYLGGALVNEKRAWDKWDPDLKKANLGEVFVVESDESDRSFLETHPTFAVVTNIDHEHLDSYDSFEELTECFLEFINRVPFYGKAILGSDCKVVRSLYPRIRCGYVTYGLGSEADWQARNIKIDQGESSFEVWHLNQYCGSVKLPLVGEHMVCNSLATFALGSVIGVSFDEIGKRLEGFAGVHRRCEVLGKFAGAHLLSDYAHHPVEVSATLAGLRRAWGDRVHLVFQPHRYSRTKACWEDYLTCFRDARSLTMLDIYSAGEPAEAGIDAVRLEQEIDHPCKRYVADHSDLKDVLSEIVSEDEVVVCMGAGSIDKVARDLLT
jgi:UDP-N-acetylmuramate--alanine ligase